MQTTATTRREQPAEAVAPLDGTELEIGAGEAYVIEPGHDAWVIGDEGFVGFEFEERSAEEYAQG